MIVWSYGGGVQTSAIAVLILQGRLPKPDVAVIADTGREMSTTWKYLKNTVQPALDTIGLQVHVASHSLSTVDMTRNGSVLIPGFSRSGDRVGKLPTYCSNEWKQRVVRRWLRKNRHNDCDVWLGISMDEVERMCSSGVKWYRHAYPLIELVPMRREQCISLVENYGWPTPPKSRCWMCPNQTHSMWQEMLKEQPDEFDQAVRLEQEIQLIDNNIWLHRAAIPLADAVQIDPQMSLFDSCDSGYCFV